MTGLVAVLGLSGCRGKEKEKPEPPPSPPSPTPGPTPGLPIAGIVPLVPVATPNYTVTLTTSGGGTVDDYVIEKMNLRKENGFDVPEVSFGPGDYITFDGDGCANRGSLGRTCYRFVDPVDGSGVPSSLYFGSVTVPGHWLLFSAQLRKIRGKEYSVSSGGVLHVDYKDNNYGDNSNDIGDDGPFDQCKSRAPARLLVHVRHGGLPPVPIPLKDYDLVAAATDGNQWPLNPMFWVQWKNGQEAAVGPGKSVIQVLEQAWYGRDPMDVDPFAAVTSQSLQTTNAYFLCFKPKGVIDGVVYRDDSLIFRSDYLIHTTYFPASFSTQRPRPATPADPVSVHETNSNVLLGEMDFSVNLWSYPRPTGTGMQFLIHGETDGWEPLLYKTSPTAAIDSTPFWGDVWGGTAVKPNISEQLPSLDDRRMFMTGLFNVDMYHDHNSNEEEQGWEAHPVFALAVSEQKLRDFNSRVTQESWHLFVRDRGQGGYCDRETKRFSFQREDRTGPELFAFDLPVDDFEEKFTVDKVEIVTTDLRLKNPAVHGIRNVTVKLVNPRTARLTVFLDRQRDPDNQQYFLAMGDVRLRYTWRQGYEQGLAPNIRAAAAPYFDGDDRNPCTVDSIDPGTRGVIHTPVKDGTSCADRNPCNGIEICRAGACVRDPIQPLPPKGTSCSDRDACNGVETCDGAGQCRRGTPSVRGPIPACTSFTCDRETGKVTKTPIPPATCKLLQGERNEP